jgi:two-component system chemotaxis response regulator CheB
MPLQNKIRVLIVDDSVFFRTALQKALSSDANIDVIGSAGSASEADKKIKELSPDVVTMDIEMPDMKGTDFIKQLIPTNPIPVVLVSSLRIGIFEALSAGAVDYVKKPNIQSSNDFSIFCQELCVKIKIASCAKVNKTVLPHSSLPLPALNRNVTSENIIAIGASTGGTETILEILRQLPPNIPGILIVQHMPAGFTKMYADRLNKLCNFSVLEAQNGDRVKPGQALIAAGDKHMTLEKDSNGYYVKCAFGEKMSGHCPSVDMLFHSVAKTAGKDAMGIILTGMGKDGAEGLLDMRKNGSFTIGQDKQSCVVYGMPMVAYDIGAVVKQVPSQAIAEVIIRKLNK